MRTGKRIICVNDSFTREQIEAIPNLPHKWEHYTVRKKLITRNGHAVLLEEIENPDVPDVSKAGTSFEPNFHVSRFRELNSDLDILWLEGDEEFGHVESDPLTIE